MSAAVTGVADNVNGATVSLVGDASLEGESATDTEFTFSSLSLPWDFGKVKT